MKYSIQWRNGLSTLRSLFLIFFLILVVGCSGSNQGDILSSDNINLIFVASPDLAYHDSGDIDPDTANLTFQGLQRSLQMATFLKQQVLDENNVTAIYTLSPMTHLQTENKYPNMTAIGYIQQFALLNQQTLPIDNIGGTHTANSYPLNVAYPSKESLPVGVAESKYGYSGRCNGLDFNNTGGINDALVSAIITKDQPGYYVFSAPWETLDALLSTINERQGYNLNLPTNYMGANHVYAISISTEGHASLVDYNSNLTPPDTYPVLPSSVAGAACTNLKQPYFTTERNDGIPGVVVPSDINKSQTVYIVRHAEAHPDEHFKFENGNFVAAGQWRALELGNTLNDIIDPNRVPNMVYSIDPAQWIPGPAIPGKIDVCYVRPSLTVLPYAIANHLPYSLVSSFSILDRDAATLASDYFFFGGTFSNQTILLGWESGRTRPLINALLASYGGDNLREIPTKDLINNGWPGDDYDTIWTVTIDAEGNLTVDNNLCEGIDSELLPETAPQF
ncbi:hypothetical protein [Desulfoluna sp.]|uniref:hypothetical protein n=1 Tax=Desulfoluna sp. TaxID=2045199 RepID=UPI002624F8AC|nr:hypothetical protein [Desulfoluna sp.]